MAISILVCFGLATFPGSHIEEDLSGDSHQVKAFPSHQVVHACAIASGFSATLLLSSGLWQNIAAAAAGSTISYTTYGVTKTHVGPVAMVLLWLAFLALLLVTVGLLALIWSMWVLNNLDWSDSGTEGDEETPLRPGGDTYEE
jgi:hypothetical protein